MADQMSLNVGKRKPEPSPQIPEFFAEKVKVNGRVWLEVTCQRTGCKQMFMVRPRAWRESEPEVINRACPYCFKVGRIPA